MLSPASADPGPAANAAVFAAGLQAERDALGAFISLLQAEQEVLIHGDAERLAALAPDKAAQIDLFTLLGEQRRRHLAAQNLTRAESARQLNQNNGLLIESRLQQNRLKLAVLQTAAAADAVYRPDGQFGPLRSTRSFSRV